MNMFFDIYEIDDLRYEEYCKNRKRFKKSEEGEEIENADLQVVD